MVLDSGTPGKPEAESDKASGSAGGRIARSAIAGRPESPDASGLRPQVQGALQRVQGRTPETGALRTHGQWFVFFYIRTDSFRYLILVPMSTWSVCLMGRSSLVPPLISRTDACVRCWATSPISFHFSLFHLY